LTFARTRSWPVHPERPGCGLPPLKDSKVLVARFGGLFLGLVHYHHRKHAPQAPDSKRDLHLPLEPIRRAGGTMSGK
ncbi:hypothetical protein, partial [Microbacterium sp. P5_E9]